jgi:flagellar biogenesis protein FliO
MRLFTANSLLLALAFSAAAPAQEPWRKDSAGPSHYRPSAAHNVSSDSPDATSGYAFPAREPANSVRQAAWNAEPSSEMGSESVSSPAKRVVPDSGREPLKLAPRSKSAGAASATRARPLNPSQAIGTVGGSLAVVLGVFLLFAWLLRKHLPAASAQLPKEAVEMLGRAPLLGRQQLSLLRVGNKLVLLAVSPLGGAEAITEITDPVEVDRLIGLCQSSRSGSVATSFRQALNEMSSERASGFLGAEERPRRRAAT